MRRRSSPRSIAKTRSPAPFAVRPTATRRSSGFPACARCRARPFEAQRLEAVLDGPLRAADGIWIAAKLAGEVRAEKKRIELERDLCWIGARIEIAFLLCQTHCFLEGRDPVAHRGGDCVADGSGSPIEFERCSGEEAATGN